MEIESFPNVLWDGRVAFAGQRQRGHPSSPQYKVLFTLE